MNFKVNVSGMECKHCTDRVENGIKALGATFVKADFVSGTVVVESDRLIEENRIKETIENLGFDFVNVEI